MFFWGNWSWRSSDEKSINKNQTNIYRCWSSIMKTSNFGVHLQRNLRCRPAEIATSWGRWGRERRERWKGRCVGPRTILSLLGAWFHGILTDFYWFQLFPRPTRIRKQVVHGTWDEKSAHVNSLRAWIYNWIQIWYYLQQVLPANTSTSPHIDGVGIPPPFWRSGPGTSSWLPQNTYVQYHILHVFNIKYHRVSANNIMIQ